MPSRRRTTATNRRPRVAGLTPGRADEAVDGATTVTETRPRPPAPADEPVEVAPPVVAEPAAAGSTAGELTAGESEAGESEAGESEAGERAAGPGPVDVAKGAAKRVPVGRRRPRPEPEAEPAAASGPGLLARLRTVPVLAGALVVLLALAVFFGVSTYALRSSPSTANTALIDIGATTEVATQLGDALEIVYSYDFARLDENERAAREVITTGFSTEFDRLFSQVRDLAPQQQAVVSATVTVSAVQEISGDRAVLVAFMDQQATTAANAEQAAAAGRLTVVGERVDGRWKIASVESR